MTESIDIARSMKKIVLTISLLAISICLKAQLTRSGLTVSEFNSITIDDVISLGEVMNRSHGISTVKSRFSNVIDQTESSNFVNDVRELSIMGLTLFYEESSSGWYFIELNLTNSYHYLSHQGTNFKVGDSIVLLEKIFSSEYSQRSDGRIVIKSRETSLFMTIYFDSNNVITSIAIKDFS